MLLLVEEYKRRRHIPLRLAIQATSSPASMLPPMVTPSRFRQALALGRAESPFQVELVSASLGQVRLMVALRPQVHQAPVRILRSSTTPGHQIHCLVLRRTMATPCLVSHAWSLTRTARAPRLRPRFRFREIARPAGVPLSELTTSRS